MAEADLEVLGRQVALLIEGQREIRADLCEIKGHLAETATRDLMLRMLRSFEGQVEVAGIRTELLRETWKPAPRRRRPGSTRWRQGVEPGPRRGKSAGITWPKGAV